MQIEEFHPKSVRLESFLSKYKSVTRYQKKIVFLGSS